MEIVLPFLVLASLVFFGAARRLERSSRAARVVRSERGSVGQPPRFASRFTRAHRREMMQSGAALAGGLLGFQVAGPVGMLGGLAFGWVVPRSLDRRRARRRDELLESQLADVVETSAVAVRSGLSIAQALEFAAAEVASPMRDFMDDLIAARMVGASLEEALERFGSALGTDEGRLFVLILSIHFRSGGNLAAPLEEVASTIQHRMAVRRELRALTAQGRVSGTILGGLPIGFFLVLSATSRRELTPIYRSPAGIAMLTVGLVLEALAYLWIRRLMRVHA